MGKYDGLTIVKPKCAKRLLVPDERPDIPIHTEVVEERWIEERGETILEQELILRYSSHQPVTIIRRTYQQQGVVVEVEKPKKAVSC